MSGRRNEEGGGPTRRMEGGLGEGVRALVGGDGYGERVRLRWEQRRRRRRKQADKYINGEREKGEKGDILRKRETSRKADKQEAREREREGRG